MIRFAQQDLNTILADYLGKPWQRHAAGPDAYDCYGLVRSFMGRVGVEVADIGKVNPEDSRPVYEREQTDYIRLPFPRPWSLVTFSNRDLRAHIGVVLPGEDLFLHCPGRAAGKVLAEPLSRRPWRDSVDGYWWPKGYIETMVLLTPMTTTKRAWQFVKAGRSLAEIIEQDITEGRNVPVQVFLDSELIPQEDWADTVPTELQQIVIRPIMGEGGQGLAMVGMIALAVLAPYASAALVGAATSATAAGATLAAGATAGQMFAYYLGTAAIMMAGGMALNALVGPDEAGKDGSQYYTWNPQTTQRVGSFVPLVYGTYGVRGNILCAYTTSEYTYNQDILYKTQQIRHATEIFNFKVAYSDGPIEGIVAGTERLNDRDPNQYSESANFTLEHFRGTDDQAASSVPDAFEVPVQLHCATNQPASTIFTAVDCDSAAVMLRFPNGCTDYEKDGGHKTTQVGVRVEVRVVDGAWHTLMNGYITGDSRDPMRYAIAFAGTHTGGTPFSLTPGTRYEAQVTRTSSTHSDKGDDFFFDCVQFGYATPQQLPGIAYTAIGAAASKDISGSIQYYAKIKGKLVCTYNAAGAVTGIVWTDNPAWIAVDLLTRPVIKGNGSTVAYTVEYYRRLDPSYITMADFIAFASWCDALVPNGESGTEKRYRFNGVFDQDGAAWDQAIRVCKMACATPYFRGHKVGLVIDKPGVPVQMFNVSNLRGGFNETWINPAEAATIYDVDFNDEMTDYAPESYPVPLPGAARDVPASLDGFGCTKRSQAWRWASRQLRINQNMKRTVEIPAALDAIYSQVGDIVYVQHPALQRASGGRIVEVYADGVKLDKSVEVAGAGASYITAVAPSGAQHITADYGNRLFVKNAVTLGTCTVVATGSVTITVRVQKFVAVTGVTGPVIAEKTFAVVAGSNSINLDIDLPANAPGEEYLLYRYGTQSLLRTDVMSFAALDYDDITMISGASASGVVVTDRYYYFFNMEVVVPATGEYALLVRTHDGTAERLSLYDVASVSGTDSDIVTIEGVWEYTPNVNDLWTFGEETKVIDLYRIKGFERTSDGQVLIAGTQYTTDYYSDDEAAPIIQAQTYSTNKGGISPALLPTTYEAIMASRTDDNSITDSLVWEGLVFTGDTVDTVTWTCESTGGAGIKYHGDWCPIMDDAVGTTDKYIYFDPAIGDPRYLQHTNNLADVLGQERYVFCVNVDGVAYFKPGVLVTSDEQKLDGIEEGADVTSHSNIASGVFLETFENPNNDLASRWTAFSGSGELSIVSGVGVAGGKVLQVGNNSGDDAVLMVYSRSIPYDPSKLYRLRFRVKRTAGTGAFYGGISGRNVDDTTYVSYTGSSDSAGRHWIAAQAVTPADWTVYTCYFKGTAATGDNTVHSNPDDPAALHQNVRYIRPMLYANYNAVAGTFQIDEVSIDIMPDGGAVGTEAIAQGAVVNYGAAYTDDFDMLNTASGEVDMQSITITSCGLPLVIHYGATVQYGSGASAAVLRLYRVGSTEPLQTSTIIKAEVGDDKGYFSAFIHTMPAGTYTYKVTTTGEANWVLVGKRFLSVTEFKR